MDCRPKCKTKNINCLEDKIGENLDDLGYDNYILSTAPKAQSMKEMLARVDFINIKNFCSAKDTDKRLKRQATDWRKKLARDISDKRLLFKIHKEHLKFNRKKVNNSISKGKGDLKRQLTEDTGSKQAHEKMLHITCNYGNANQSNNEVPLHSY